MREGQSAVIKWPYDAENLRIDALDYIYQTDDIKDFLKREGKFFVCGLRGLGKTLVLKAKRKTYFELPEDELNSYLIIPNNGQLDVLVGFHPNEDYWDLFKDITLWKEIWGLSIGLSVLSHFLHQSTKLDSSDLEWKIENLPVFQIEKDEKEKKFIRSLLDWTIKAESNPSWFVTHILNYMNRTIYKQKIISEAYNNVYNILIENIRSGCAVFIDQVDKAWEELMSEFCDKPEDIYKLQKLQEIWYSTQIGLILAINDICTRNHHIRIYTAIRQEVLGRFEKDPNYLRHIDKMLIISYEKGDLKCVFEKAIKAFEDEKNLTMPNKIRENAIKAFLGLEKVKPFRIKTDEQEDIFSYMYRHSIQRPRDICYIGRGVSEINPKKRSEDRIKELINERSEYNLINDYLGDLKRLANIDFDMAYSLIDKNILKKEELTSICSDYNRIIEKSPCNRDCARCDRTHLFCLFYNIGLIGIVEKNFYSYEPEQKFLEPEKRNLILTNPIIPNSEVYLLHPVLCHVIERKRAREGLEFHCENTLIVGHLRKYHPVNASSEEPSGTLGDVSKMHKSPYV